MERRFRRLLDSTPNLVRSPVSVRPCSGVGVLVHLSLAGVTVEFISKLPVEQLKAGGKHDHPTCCFLADESLQAGTHLLHVHGDVGRCSRLVDGTV